MKIKDIQLNQEDIKLKINKYNEDYVKMITKVNTISRTLAQCSNSNKHTLI